MSKLWGSLPMEGLEAKYIASQKEDSMKKQKSLKTWAAPKVKPTGICADGLYIETVFLYI